MRYRCRYTLHTGCAAVAPGQRLPLDRVLDRIEFGVDRIRDHRLDRVASLPLRAAQASAALGVPHRGGVRAGQRIAEARAPAPASTWSGAARMRPSDRNGKQNAAARAYYAWAGSTREAKQRPGVCDAAGGGKMPSVMYPPEGAPDVSPGQLPLRPDRVHPRGRDRDGHRLQLLVVPAVAATCWRSSALCAGPFTTPEADIATYTFNSPHHSPSLLRPLRLRAVQRGREPKTGEATVAVNVRCPPDVELASLKVMPFDRQPVLQLRVARPAHRRARDQQADRAGRHFARGWQGRR